MLPPTSCGIEENRCGGWQNFYFHWVFWWGFRSLHSSRCVWLVCRYWGSRQSPCSPCFQCLITEAYVYYNDLWLYDFVKARRFWSFRCLFGFGIILRPERCKSCSKRTCWLRDIRKVSWRRESLVWGELLVVLDDVYQRKQHQSILKASSQPARKSLSRKTVTCEQPRGSKENEPTPEAI